MKSPSIAIVGTEGCGKTVLITVLAKYLERPDLQGTCLEPRGIETVRAVERVWELLTHSEWPPSTPPGQLPRMHWLLHVGSDGPECRLQIADAAGQDLRRLFAEEMIEREAVLDHLREVGEYIRNADIVLFLINLRDFVGESDNDRRIENQWAIKYAMDWLKKQPGSRNWCLVLTQVDQYGRYLEECKSWSDVIKRHLPQIYDFHVRGGRTRIIPVAAVRDTIVDTQGNSTPRRVPAPGFKWKGLEELVEWLRQSIAAMSDDDGEIETTEPIKEPEQRKKYPKPPPATPIVSSPNVTAEALSPTTAQLSWNAVSGSPQGYRIYETIVLQTSLVATVDASTTSYHATGLTAGSNVSFKVQAFNATSVADSRDTTLTMAKTTDATFNWGSTWWIIWTMIFLLCMRNGCFMPKPRSIFEEILKDVKKVNPDGKR